MTTKHELILCIVNTGYSETVMDAAKEKGARGGTVINARGTANKQAEEFFHITIQPEKEIVMIIVPTNIKEDVLHAIYKEAGLKTDGQGIAFCLPVDHVVGLNTDVDRVISTMEKHDKADKQAKKAEKAAAKNDGDATLDDQSSEPAENSNDKTADKKD